jgi:hypothetical protein
MSGLKELIANWGPKEKCKQCGSENLKITYEADATPSLAKGEVLASLTVDVVCTCNDCWATAWLMPLHRFLERTTTS